MDKADELRWIEHWREAGPALEEQRRRELCALTPERALFFAEALLSLVRPEALPRRTHSGLVEQQALFRLFPSA